MQPKRQMRSRFCLKLEFGFIFGMNNWGIPGYFSICTPQHDVIWGCLRQGKIKKSNKTVYRYYVFFCFVFPLATDLLVLLPKSAFACQFHLIHRRLCSCGWPHFTSSSFQLLPQLVLHSSASDFPFADIRLLSLAACLITPSVFCVFYSRFEYLSPSKSATSSLFFHSNSSPSLNKYSFQNEVRRASGHGHCACIRRISRCGSCVVW